MRSLRILYLSYDGLMEPLGQSQVLAYLERLAADHRISLVSFEKTEDDRVAGRRAAIAARVDEAGIDWHPLRYHKRPTVPATAFDIARGVAEGLSLARRHSFDIVHARSFVPALMGSAIRRATGARLLFDMRGLWSQERVDGGLWPDGGRLHRNAARLEGRLVATADHLVTLTEASRPALGSIAAARGAALPPVTVIPTCADLARFSPSAITTPGPFTLGYVGSIGTWYLFDEVLRFFLAVRTRRPEARLLVVNRDAESSIRLLATEAGIPPEALEVTAAEHGQVPALIRRMHAGVALVRPLPSKQASAPTKFAEYLGCGVPCVGNGGVGDMGSLIEAEGIGVTLHGFTDEAHGLAADRLLALCASPDIAARCRIAALRHFSLEEGVARYRAVYAGLAA